MKISPRLEKTANFVLWYLGRKNIYINRHTLSRILFLISISYLICHKKKLFVENFEQSENGPVFMPIYETYNKYGDQKITRVIDKPRLNLNHSMFLIKIIKSCIKSQDKDLTLKLVQKID